MFHKKLVQNISHSPNQNKGRVQSIIVIYGTKLHNIKVVSNMKIFQLFEIFDTLLIIILETS